MISCISPSGETGEERLLIFQTFLLRTPLRHFLHNTVAYHQPQLAAVSHHWGLPPALLMQRCAYSSQSWTSREKGRYLDSREEDSTAIQLLWCRTGGIAEELHGDGPGWRTRGGPEGTIWEPLFCTHSKLGFRGVWKLLSQSTHFLFGFRQLRLRTRGCLHACKKRWRTASGWKHCCPHSTVIYGSNVGLDKNSLWPHSLNVDLYSNTDFREATVERKKSPWMLLSG